MNLREGLEHVFSWNDARTRRGRRAFVTMAFAMATFSSEAFAVEPPPGGGYPNEVTAVGRDALFSLTSGNMNTAVGFQALYSNTIGAENTAMGDQALRSNTTGGANVGLGNYALFTNTTGTYNIAVGDLAMSGNSTGGGNVAMGLTALSSNTTGFNNVAIGFDAMSFSTTGSYNTAIGNVAMAFNSTGSENTAVGDGAMNKSSGSNNIAIGQSAGLNLAGNNNIALGQFAGQNVTTGANNIEIGSEGGAKDTNLIRLGTIGTQRKTFIAGINGATVSGGVAVMVNSKGQLGVATSSTRYKQAIKPMKEASEAILSLEPVTFRYKQELDPEAIPQFGLVAEEVAKVDPDLVARDEEGKPYTVRYEAVNAMLLNEFLKEHRKVAEQSGEIAELKASVAELKAAMQQQATDLRKVSASVATDQSAARVVSTGE